MADASISNPISRRKVATFVPEKPCRHGHMLRRVTDRRCVPCMAKKDAAWQAVRVRVYTEEQKRRYSERARVRKYDRAHRDQNIAIKYYMRGVLSGAMRSKRSLALFALLGYSANDLRSHIERQFLPGMSWNNRSDWEVDHIVPASCFGEYRIGDAEFHACWGLANLQPMWAEDNRAKSATRRHLL